VLAILWVSMMLAWLGGLILGVWWVWPHIQRMTLTVDLVSGLLWLSVGTTAWLVALNLGYQRFWRRKERADRKASYG
jgi:hypothetical protein